MQKASMLGINTSLNYIFDNKYIFDDPDGLSVIIATESRCKCGRSIIALPKGISNGERYWIENSIPNSED